MQINLDIKNCLFCLVDTESSNGKENGNGNIYKTMNICKNSQTVHSGKKMFILVILTMN